MNTYTFTFVVDGQISSVKVRDLSAQQLPAYLRNSKSWVEAGSNRSATIAWNMDVDVRECYDVIQYFKLYRVR